jgi:hypothetical protein
MAVISESCGTSSRRSLEVAVGMGFGQSNAPFVMSDLDATSWIASSRLAAA